MGFSTDPEHERFEIRRRLGGGGMGEVFEAFDRERQELVALKTLRTRNAAGLYSFKKEFRTLANVSHPNLVSLYELIVDDDHWFYTMELIEGESLKDYTRPLAKTLPIELASPGSGGASFQLDGARLRGALLQMASGVKAVHDAGKLHRDLKPSNVMVTPRGRVVLLDFGVATELNPLMRSIDTGIAGTAAYMAPEQARGEPAQPASDWYAVGVILFEILTGRWPFTGSLARILIDKQFLAAPSPGELVRDLPTDLADLCRSLLELDPASRPTGSEIVRRLGGTGTAELLLKAPGLGESPLVGRRAHLVALEEAFSVSRDERPVSVYVHGSSGIGKTALVTAFLQRLRARTRAVTLHGRCFEHEAVPYKALDGVIDSLSRYLRHLNKNLVEELLPSNTNVLARLFPVLLRVDPVALTVEALPEEERRRSEERDRSTQRRQALDALRRLLTRLSAISPVVIFVDDLQWADADSAVLLRDLMQADDAPQVLLVASFRSEEVDSRSFLQDLLAHTGTESCRQLAVGPLSDEEASELARISLGLDGERDKLVEAIVVEAHGSPFLVEHLARHALATRSTMGTGINLREMLAVQLAEMPDGSAALLRVLAVAGKPLLWSLARKAAGGESEDRRLLATLKAACLLRGSDDLVELYHDRIRETLLEDLDPAEEESVHGRLAAVLDEAGVDDPETLMEHYRRAGDTARAARMARQAADRAASALAFERAAQLYRLALDLGHLEDDERLSLLHGLADSLALAGRTRQAADLHLELAETARGRAALEYRRSAAMEYLMSGSVDEGLSQARQVLRAVGLEMPAGRFLRVTSFLWHRLQLWLRRYRYRRREASQIPARRLLRIDTCWTVTAGLQMVGVMRAVNLQARHLLLALESGEARRVARALAMEVAFQAPSGSAARRRAARLRQRAHELADEIGDGRAAALATLQDGVSAYFDGAWRAAVEICDRAEALFLAGSERAVWEITAARRFALSALSSMGQIREVSRRLPEQLREAVEHGNVYGANELRTRLNVFWLAADDPEEARRRIDEAAGSWNQAGFSLSHWNLLAARVRVDLYTGHGVDALAAIEEHWPRLAESDLLRIQMVRLEALLLRSRSALAAAIQERSRRAELARLALGLARRLENEKLSQALPLATLVRASGAHLQGDAAGAREGLERAAFGFEASDMLLHSTAAWRRLGELMGGAAGQELIHRSDAWLKAESVKDPVRMTAMVAPGFRPK